MRAAAGLFNPDLRADMNTQTFIDDTMRDMNRRRLDNAAPDLLEACRRALITIGVARKYFPKSIRNSDTFQLLNAGVTLNKAIRKAEGAE